MLTHVVGRCSPEEAGLQYGSPAVYINTLFSSRFYMMDAALMHRSYNVGNRYLAWQWFIDEYFPRHVFKRAHEAYYDELIVRDQIRNQSPQC